MVHFSSGKFSFCKVRLPVSCCSNWGQDAWVDHRQGLYYLWEMLLAVMMKLLKNRGLPSKSPMTPTSSQYVEGMDRRNSLCTNLRHPPPHSSKLFALKILTKELSQMPECLHAQAANSCCRKRMRCCIQRRCFLCQVFRQSKECFEGNIYNIRQNPLRSKSCHSLVDPPKY